MDTCRIYSNRNFCKGFYVGTITTGPNGISCMSVMANLHVDEVGTCHYENAIMKSVFSHISHMCQSIEWRCNVTKPEKQDETTATETKLEKSHKRKKPFTFPTSWQNRHNYVLYFIIYSTNKAVSDMYFLVNSHRRSHSGLNIQWANILPILLEQWNKEVDSHVNICNKLFFLHLDVTNSNSQTQHLNEQYMVMYVGQHLTTGITATSNGSKTSSSL